MKRVSHMILTISRYLLLVRRDISALNGMKNILRLMLTTDIFLRSTLNQQIEANWNTFWADLKLSLQNTVDVPGNPSRTGRVLVTTATDARGSNSPRLAPTAPNYRLRRRRRTPSLGTPTADRSRWSWHHLARWRVLRLPWR